MMTGQSVELFISKNIISGRGKRAASKSLALADLEVTAGTESSTPIGGTYRQT
jgi:hypothetical protein